MYSNADDAFVVVLGLLDSGARHNWISRDLVVRLGLCPVKLVEQADFEDFQGGIFSAYEHVKLNWYGKSKCTREGYFLVAEKGPFDIVIGSDFLFSAEVFTYNETVLMYVPNPKSDSMLYHCSLLLLHWTDSLAENEADEKKSENDQKTEEEARLADRKPKQEVKKDGNPQDNAQSSTGTKGSSSRS